MLKNFWLLLFFIFPSHFALAAFTLSCESPQIPYRMSFPFPLWGKIGKVELYSKKGSDFKLLIAKCDKKQAKDPLVAVCQFEESPQNGIKISLMTIANTKVDWGYLVSYTPYGPAGDETTVQMVCPP